MKIQNKGSSFSHLRVGSSNRVRSLLPLGAGFKGQTMLQQVLPFQFVISLNPVSLVYRIQVVFDLRPARLTTARLYDRFPGKARQLYR